MKTLAVAALILAVSAGLALAQPANDQERKEQAKPESRENQPQDVAAQPDYRTALYYTFSTISQTLAGVLGFLGAFMLFRLSRLLDKLNENVGALIAHGNFAGDLDFQQQFRQGSYRAILNRLNQPAFAEQLTEPLRAITLPLAGRLLTQRRQMAWWICVVAVLSVVTIVASVGVLWATPWLTLSIASIILPVGLGALALCLAAMLVLLFISLA